MPLTKSLLRFIVIPLVLTVVVTEAKHILRSTNIDTSITKLFKQKCLRNSDEKAHSDFVAASKTLQECFDAVVPAEVEASTTPHIICGEAVRTGYQCYTSYLEKLNRCLDPVREHHVSEMMVDFYNGTMNEICKYQDNIEEYKKNYDVFQATVFMLVLGNMLDPCWSNTNLAQKLDQTDFIIEKQDLCSDMEYVKQCLLARLPKDKGEGYQLPADFLTSLFTSYMATCKQEGYNNDV